MALYHFHSNIVKRSSGHSATAAVAYQSGTKIVDRLTGVVQDYSKRRGVAARFIVAPRNVPSWVKDRAELWNQVELAEKRGDAQLCRSFDIALMCELTKEQNLKLLQDFCGEQFAKKGMIADIAVHNDHDGNQNIHAHVKLTMREITPEGFGNKNRDWNDKKLLEQWREQWATHANRALEQAGQTARIDHRSLEAQGLDLIPTKHLGRAAKLEKNGVATVKGDYNRTVGQINAATLEIKESDLKAARITAQIIDLQAERQKRQAAQEQPITRPVDLAKSKPATLPPEAPIVTAPAPQVRKETPFVPVSPAQSEALPPLPPVKVSNLTPQQPAVEPDWYLKALELIWSLVKKWRNEDEQAKSDQIAKEIRQAITSAGHRDLYTGSPMALDGVLLSTRITDEKKRLLGIVKPAPKNTKGVKR